ncbi:hypothetical protein KI688_009979 [Linnemannia hyalina]|uniref:Uncharacterized protein n=1 Tax=Linnemannia hyalina TaxID=64524 RepID=A0A9P8BVE9_9FUNG|nr:hypothetical protein KI688_009979 [Linnemannia hyalina]
MESTLNANFHVVMAKELDDEDEYDDAYMAAERTTESESEDGDEGVDEPAALGDEYEAFDPEAARYKIVLEDDDTNDPLTLPYFIEVVAVFPQLDVRIPITMCPISNTTTLTSRRAPVNCGNAGWRERKAGRPS